MNFKRYAICHRRDGKGMKIVSIDQVPVILGTLDRDEFSNIITTVAPLEDKVDLCYWVMNAEDETRLRDFCKSYGTQIGIAHRMGYGPQ